MQPGWISAAMHRGPGSINQPAARAAAFKVNFSRLVHRRWAPSHSFTRLSRSALAITLTDDIAIAAAAITGDSRMPKNG